MKTVNVYIAKIERELPDVIFNCYLNRIPNKLKERNQKFVRWQDKHANLFGKILLLNGLQNIGYKPTVLNKINYNNYSRPYLNDMIDFNISHSDCFVLCAIGQGINLGIDIEKIKAINLDYFHNTMNSAQWKFIFNAYNPLEAFFNYWTIKECTIKADGRGLSVSLPKINVYDFIAHCENHLWYIHKLDINAAYCSHLATSIQNIDIKYIFIDMYEFADKAII